MGGHGLILHTRAHAYTRVMMAMQAASFGGIFFVNVTRGHSAHASLLNTPIGNCLIAASGLYEDTLAFVRRIREQNLRRFDHGFYLIDMLQLFFDLFHPSYKNNSPKKMQVRTFSFSPKNNQLILSKTITEILIYFAFNFPLASIYITKIE